MLITRGGKRKNVNYIFRGETDLHTACTSGIHSVGMVIIINLKHTLHEDDKRNCSKAEEFLVLKCQT